MSSGIKASSSIPNNVRKMIQNLKEIYLNHTDDEIYAILKECNMDPNETAQKLLHQDTFHEVKRRRYRKPEQTNREIVESRRSGPPGRGGRGGRGYHLSHGSVQEAGDGRNTSFRKENGFVHASSKASSNSSVAVAHEGKRKDKSSPATEVANGPVGVFSGGTEHSDASNVLPETVTKQPEIFTRPRSRSGGGKRSNLISGPKAQCVSAATFSGVCSPASDPVLVPTNDTRVSAVGAIKREVGIQRSPVEMTSNIFAEHKSNASKLGGKSQGAGKSQATEILQSSSLNHGSSSSSRPSSNYGSRSQHGMGSLKVGPNKEWKPKPMNTNTVQSPKSPAASESTVILPETCSHSQPSERTNESEEAITKLQQELEGLHVRDAQHVIIPSHIHVPEAVRTGLSFGSFDAAFVIHPKHPTEPENEVSKTVSQVNQGKEDLVEEQTSSQNTLTPADGVEYADCSSISEQAETLSPDVVAPSSSVPDLSDSKEMTNVPQNSSIHSSSSYSFDVMPPIIGNHLGQMEGSETQARDVSRAPGFVVRQPVDSSSFYAQFYRPASDNDGRVSPFGNHGVASKYGALPSQSSASLSESGNTMVLPTQGPPLATQASGVMPSSITVTQQPLPIFRHPAGIHMPHYPPNLIPYGHYFSPFYVPPPAMHQFLGNNPFPQQAQPGNLYPPPPAPSAPTALKFPLSQYKPGNNAGNSAHMGVGGGYGPYGVSPTGFNPGPPPAPGNGTTSEDLAASHFKDNVYITGQQTEGSAVWFQGPGRDMSSLPANAFYNLHPQGQHVTYAPTQAGQAPYAGIFHPGQAVTAATVHPLLQQSQAMPGTVDMVGATGSVYQQPQHGQINWPNNY
ncbi:hypothetical protein RND81_09G184300 [Saponaria officinalis]|uniref:GBF-interacting protein 1 N-terminal domain-containing protein n=1 Tax=Saponaria officinalis TaxID=3572 RepID=A0AAW1INL4_SAPOF